MADAAPGGAAGGVTRLAPAKINLTLHVRGLRADGFHDLESLVARVELCDEVAAAPRRDGRLTLACDEPGIPCDDSNLALRAARALRTFAGQHGTRARGHTRKLGADLRLRKRIPAGGGLGGGSSDAATTLMLLKDVWGLNAPAAELAALGATVGSDVPLFFDGPLCVLRGRGDRVEAWTERLAGWVVLVLPGWHAATPAVYRAWDELAVRPARPPADDLRPLLKAPAALMEALFNDLEPATFRLLPALRELSARIAAETGLAVRMSGSGSTLFRVFGREEEARAFANAVAAYTQHRTEVAALRT